MQPLAESKKWTLFSKSLIFPKKLEHYFLMIVFTLRNHLVYNFIFSKKI